MDLRKLARSFVFAFRGLKTVFIKEQNFQIHALIALGVIGLGLVVGLRAWEWIIITLVILVIFVLEMLNTVFERLVDMLKPRLHLYAGEIKNIMSGAVLIAAFSAVIIGVLIFWPYFKAAFLA